MDENNSLPNSHFYLQNKTIYPPEIVMRNLEIIQWNGNILPELYVIVAGNKLLISYLTDAFYNLIQDKIVLIKEIIILLIKKT